jgi:hypothetical protein
MKWHKTNDDSDTIQSFTKRTMKRNTMALKNPTLLQSSSQILFGPRFSFDVICSEQIG